jgi:hypothetical protein
MELGMLRSTLLLKSMQALFLRKRIRGGIGSWQLSDNLINNHVSDPFLPVEYIRLSKMQLSFPIQREKLNEFCYKATTPFS